MLLDTTCASYIPQRKKSPIHSLSLYERHDLRSHAQVRSRGRGTERLLTLKSFRWPTASLRVQNLKFFHWDLKAIQLSPVTIQSYCSVVFYYYICHLLHVEKSYSIRELKKNSRKYYRNCNDMIFNDLLLEISHHIQVAIGGCNALRIEMSLSVVLKQAV